LTWLFEQRRKAPSHFHARARNARFSAAFLWRAMDNADCSYLAEEISYGGNPKMALYASFQREAAISLELIIKAVIAIQIERGVAAQHVNDLRATHDLTTLWRDAGLPKLAKPEQRCLVYAKQIMLWAGRYPTPTREDAYEREEAEMEGLHEVVGRLGKFPIIQAGGYMTWETVDKVFSFASDEFHRIYILPVATIPRP